jgi:hypothetical protein
MSDHSGQSHYSWARHRHQPTHVRGLLLLDQLETVLLLEERDKVGGRHAVHFLKKQFFLNDNLVEIPIIIICM